MGKDTMLEMVGVAGAPHHRIEGTAYGRPASIEVHDSMVRWRGRRGDVHPAAEELDIPQTELVIFAAHEDRATGIAFGVFLIMIAAIWITIRSAAPLVCLGIAAIGVAIVALRRLFPTTVIEVRTPDVRLVLRARRASAPAAWEAAEHMQRHQPRLAGVSAPGVLAALRGEIRVLFAGEDSLRHEFQHRAGAAGTSAQEDRFVRVRRRMARWNVGWMIALPIIAVAGLQFLLPRVQPGWMLLRAAVDLVLLFIACVWLQARLLPSASKWMNR
jgi:hypothetical protein